MEEQVAFYVQGRDKTIYFTSDGLTIAIKKGKVGGEGNAKIGPEDPRSSDYETRWVVKLDFVGSNKKVYPVGLERSGAIISYFRGKSDEWNAGLPAFSKVAYRDLWPGIDLLYYGTFDRMKYEFVVHPGADPSQIKLAYRGAERVSLTREGRLEVQTPAGSFTDDIPLAFQEFGAERKEVNINYQIQSERPSQLATAGSGREEMPEAATVLYGFTLGEYDGSRTLVIDPAVLVYCGYIGGSGDGDYINAITVDETGSAYVVGSTDSTQTTFPVAVGPDLTYGGALYDAFVAKIDASGTALIYCGYIGGGGIDTGRGIAVDSLGQAYVTGTTTSTQASFPEIVGPDLTSNGNTDGFIAKVNASGTALIYCGFIGGSGVDEPSKIAIDSSGNAYVTGSTSSTQSTFPVTVGPDLTHNGLQDVFVAKVNASGATLDYCGYIGGSNTDKGFGIAVDGSGNAYVTGETYSFPESFPVLVGPVLTRDPLYYDAFVAKVNASGSALDYCGYIGGEDVDGGYGIAVDTSGCAYVTGYTASWPDFPRVVGPDLTYNDIVYSQDAFVAKVAPTGDRFIYCGFIGGMGADTGNSIAVDRSGNAYVAGTTQAPESSFPVKEGPDLTQNGGSDAFVAKVNAYGTELVYAGYIGGTSNDSGLAVAVDVEGNAYVAGQRAFNSAAFPVMVGPDLTYNGGLDDAFVAKISYSNSAVSITSPSDGATVSGVVQIQIDTFDPKGIFRVEAYIDGVLMATDTTYPYSFSWNTTGLLGAHTIKVAGYNSLEHVTEDQVAVNVVNELPPSITVQPLSQFINSGQTVLLYVEASGTEPLAFQWYRGASGDTSEPISGATSNSYAVLNSTSSSSYWVKVSNAYGDSFSDTAIITMGLPSKLVGSVLDLATKVGISGAVVSLGDYPQVATDENGLYEIPNLSPGEYSFMISAANYSSLTGTVGISISSTITRNFFMTQSLSGDFFIDSLTSKYGGFVYYLEGVPFSVTYTAHVYWGGHPPGKVRFITSSEQQYDVPTEGDTASRVFNMGTDFIPCQTLRAVAISADGSQSEIKNADFTVMPGVPSSFLLMGYDRVSSFYYESAWSQLELIDLDLGDNIIPQDIPLFGKRGFSFSVLPRIGIKVESSGQVDIDVDPVQMKKEEKSWAQGKMAGFEFTLAPRIHVSGQYSPSECRYQWDGYLGLSGEFEIERSWPFIWWAAPIPIPMYAKATFDLSMDALLRVHDLYRVDLDGELNFYPYVRGSLGAGINRHLAVEGWIGGGGEFLARYPETPHLHDANIYINAGFSAHAFLFEWEVELMGWDWAMNEGTGEASIVDEPGPVKPKAISRDYLRTSEPGRFLNSPVMKPCTTSEGRLSPQISSAPLQQSIYPYSDPCLCYGAGSLGLTWLQDDPARLAINRTAAMFSIYNGSAWSAPVKLGEDGTADFHPQHLMFDGANALAVWEDEKIVHSDTATFEDMVADLEISASAFDPISGQWQPAQRLTDNGYLDGSPLISGPSPSNVMLTWISNEGNDLRGSPSAPNTLWFSLYNGTAWSIPQVAAQIPLGILKYSLAYNGTTGHIVLSLDMDGDAATVADNEIYRLTYSSGAWGTLTRFTEDILPDVNPKVAFDPSGSTVLVWMRGNELSCSLDFAPPTVILTDEFSTNLADFKMAVSGAGRIALIWTEPAEYNSDLRVIFYDPAYQTWASSPHQITFDPEVERNVAVAFNGANDLVAAYDRTPISTTPLNRMAANGKMVTLDIPQPGTTDLYVLEYVMGRDLALSPLSLRASPLNPEPGAGVTLTVTVTNTGDETAAGVPVAFYLGDPLLGNIIGEAATPSIFRPGDTADVSILWKVPDMGSPYLPLTIYAVIDPASNFDAGFRGNNTLSIEIVKPDLAINGVNWEWLGADKVLLTARILNMGAIPSSQPVRVKFRQGSSSGPLISERYIPELAKNEFRDVTVEWDVSGLSLLAYPVHVVVDEENWVVEADKNNNAKLTTVTPESIVDSIIVMSPNGGESWTAGSIQPIQWATSGIVGGIKIEYSTDGGGTFAEIIASTPNSGRFDWTVPNPPSLTCLIRVSGTNGSPVDTSDAIFMVLAAPTVTVTSPNGSETWDVGTSPTVTWTQTDLSGLVTVDLYKGGIHRKTMGTAEANAAAFSCLLSSDIGPGTDYRIRISQGSVWDESDADFSITPHIRVDFNRDGEEDILWRYYGEGGYNRAWFLRDSSEQPESPQTVIVARMEVGRQRDRSTSIKASKATLSDPREIGLISNPPGQLLTVDPQVLMGAGQDRISGAAIVDDPRKAGGRFVGPSPATIADPRQVKRALKPDAFSDTSAVLAAAPILLGGADVMPVGDLNWHIVGTADFNNDTNVDILWRYNGPGGYNVVWYMNGAEWAGSAELLPVNDLNWQIVGTGDFNNDTHADILWRNILSGENVVWYMEGAAWTGSAALLGVSDQSWQIVGTGDFNKDGNLDVLWRYNGSGGFNVVWYLNNATWTGSAELIPVADTNWQIMGTG
ncbi:MAG: hypothetical protein C3F08_02710, partial [Candidatus Methylomirabilota bacterium]